MFGLFQADVLPAFAAVGAFVNAIAIADTALTVVLAGADPKNVFELFGSIVMQPIENEP